MPRKILRTREGLDHILADGGLDLVEQFDPEKSYPKNIWLLTRCKKCSTEAHYRLQYIIDKADSTEPTCRACFWTDWLKESARFSTCETSSCVDSSSARAFANKYGFDIIDMLIPPIYGQALLLVRCQECGRQTVERECDIMFRCSCQRHPDTSAHYAPTVTRTVIQRPAVCQSKTIMSIEEAKTTPISEVQMLLEAWDDERDPYTTMVYPTKWYGMYPGDGQYRFKCSNGHHPYVFPYTYLLSGCPSCQANATKGTGLFLADTSPELSAEWVLSRSGKWTPENVRQNSKREVWWRCLACDREWITSSRARTKRDDQCCPSCGKIMGSIAWLYPQIAAEWSPDNPISPWLVRPHAKLAFTPLWICAENPNHIWSIQVSSRVAGGECPECIDSGKSRVELRYFEAARKLFGDARSGARFENPRFSTTWTIDISTRYRGRKIAIEYDGAYWHADKAGVDERKSRELITDGFLVIRIRERGLPELSVDSPNYSEVFVTGTKQQPDVVLQQVIILLDSMLIDE